VSGKKIWKEPFGTLSVCRHGRRSYIMKSDLWKKTFLPVLGTILAGLGAYSVKIDVIHDKNQTDIASSIQQVSISFLKKCDNQGGNNGSDASP
jgi:hypothetical protein